MAHTLLLHRHLRHLTEYEATDDDLPIPGTLQQREKKKKLKVPSFSFPSRSTELLRLPFRRTHRERTAPFRMFEELALISDTRPFNHAQTPQTQRDGRQSFPANFVSQ